jgi:uncharacterized protein (TIGR02453 family)
VSATFRGWPAEALDFFSGLEADNSKGWWQAHKVVYDQAVRGPMDALLDDLTSEFGEAKVFRPNRDIRFSADKSPYKTHIGAIAWHGRAGFYVQLSADGLSVGVGSYAPDPPTLARLRAAIADDRSGAELEPVVAGLEAAGFGLLQEGALKTAPRGIPADHPRIRLLRLRHLAVVRSWPPAGWLHTRKALDRVAASWRAGRPLVGWANRHLGG